MPSRMTHDRWPDVVDQTELWNVAGSPNQDGTLAVGDLCYSLFEATLWGCTDATLGAAAWFPAMAITGDVNIVELLGHTMLDGGANGILPVGGAAADAAALVGNPVPVGGVDGSGNVQSLLADSDGHLQVDILTGGGGGAVSGDVAHDTVDSGAPVKIGGKATAAAPVSVDEGDRVDASFDLSGSLRTVGTSVVGGAAADGAAVSGNPVRVAGKDGAGNTQDVATDTDGQLQVDVLTLPAVSGSVSITGTPAVTVSSGAVTVSGTATVSGPAADGAAVSGNPVRIAGKDGAGNTQDIATDTEGRLRVVGNVAHDEADAGSPIKLGGKASSAVPGAVGGGDRVNAYFGTDGRLHVSVVGFAAEDDAATGNPVLGGGRFDTAPRTLDDGDVGAVALDAAGRQIVVGPAAVDAAALGDPVMVGGIANAADPADVDENDVRTASFDLAGCLRMRSKSYDALVGADKVSPTYTDAWGVETVPLIDTTNVAADANYPSDGGLDMDGYKDVSLTGQLIDVTVEISIIVEGTNDQDPTPASRVWHQIFGWDSKNDAMTNEMTVTDGTLNFAWDFDNWNYKYLRVGLDVNSADNTVNIQLRRKAL